MLNFDHTLLSLAEVISANAKVLTEHLTKTKSSLPSLDLNGPATLDIPPECTEASAARAALIDSVNMMHVLALGPSEYLKHMAMNNKNELAAVGVLTHWEIPSKVPPQGCTFEEISLSTGLPLDRIRRILRLAMSSFIFCEPTEGLVAHTAVSMALRDDENLSAVMDHNYEVGVNSSANLVRAMEKWPDSEEPSETAFAMGFGTEKNLFGWMQEEPWRAERFGKAMVSLLGGGRHDPKHVARGFDWESLDSGKVVDIGGSSGHVSVAIAQSFPNLQLIIEDLPEIEEQSKLVIPEDLKARIEFKPHSFWEPQPVKDAGVYILRHVLHDWSDKYSIKILQNIIPSMKKGSQILIIDSVLSTETEIPKYQEKILRGLDMTMLTTFNSKERTERDWVELLGKTDERLKFLGINKPSGCADGFIVARFEG